MCSMSLKQPYYEITYTLFTSSKNYLEPNVDCNLDRNPEDVPVYMEHSLFNTTKRITLLFIAQSLLHRNPPNIWIIFIQNVI